MYEHDGYMSLRYLRRKLSSMTTLVDGETLSRAQRSGCHQFGRMSCPKVGWSLVPVDPLSAGPLSVSVLTSEPCHNGSSVNSYSPMWPCLPFESGSVAVLRMIITIIIV